MNEVKKPDFKPSPSLTKSGFSSSEASRMYGSFLVEDVEFALPVSSVAEVVNQPEQFVKIPLSPRYFLGVFNLRGTIIPVIDLKTIFQFAGSTTSATKAEGGKVAIVEHLGHKVGLLFDQTNQILRDAHVQLTEFSSDQGSNQPGAEFKDVVSGVLKLDGGKRLIQLLSPAAIIRLDYFRAKNSSEKNTSEKRAHLVVRSRKCISFDVEDSTLAFSIDEISEIIQPPVIHPTAVSTDSCLGIINLRGGIVPVLDFGHLLKYRKKVDRNNLATDQKILILNIKNNRVGFLVDRIESIVSYHEDDILPIPTVENERPKMYKGCLSLNSNVDGKSNAVNVVFLSSDQVLTDSEVQMVTRLHNELYQNKLDEQKQKVVVSKTARKAYISFKIESLFCLEMDDVRELIEFPNELIQPPGLPDFVSGMLNLRGKIVTVINTRTLYGLKSQASDEGEGQIRSKVIIFSKNGKDFGLVVDSVESILNPVDFNVLEIPKGDNSRPENVFSSDSKFIMSLKIQDKTQNLVVLNLNSIVERTGFARAG